MSAPRIPRKREAANPVHAIVTLIGAFILVALTWIAALEMLALLRWLGWIWR